MGRNQYWGGRVYELCVYYMMGTPEGSTESGFMEKPGFEPATPGLQGIALIQYTTGASQQVSHCVISLVLCIQSTTNPLGIGSNSVKLKKKEIILFCLFFIQLSTFYSH